MKRILSLIFVSVLGGAIALGSYKLFFEEDSQTFHMSDREASHQNVNSASVHKTYAADNFGTSAANPDFTEAAEKTIEAVVHVKNVKVSEAPRNMSEYLRGIRGGKFVRGMGSGVIVTPDGFIVTNNHVIEGANELEVTLSNNRTYKAKVIGADPQEDIALIKIDADDLNYLPFGDSNSIRVGQWVLAVGNPFNLTSTVTAGIISAKGRNLDEGGAKMQSYLQTDAVVNPGNSGGALVNTNGELIGINTAITSQTGSYIGYSFAVPSNNARKIVEDLMEFGDVKNAILGVRGGDIDAKGAKEKGFPTSQGVYVASASDGAKKAGLKEGDLIIKVEGVSIRKISDLISLMGTKRPGDKVQVNYYRDGKEHMVNVKLTEHKVSETYVIKLEQANLEVTDADEEYLKDFNASHGVRLTDAVSKYIGIPADQVIIIAIDGHAVKNVQDVKNIMEHKRTYERTYITFQSRDGQRETLEF